MTIVEEYIQTLVQSSIRPYAEELSTELRNLLTAMNNIGLLRKKRGGKVGEKSEILVESERTLTRYWQQAISSMIY
jgi:hypothetical protein